MLLITHTDTLRVLTLVPPLHHPHHPPNLTMPQDMPRTASSRPKTRPRAGAEAKKTIKKFSPDCVLPSICTILIGTSYPGVKSVAG